MTMRYVNHRPIVLAAGGTGGHIFPAEALARALLDRGRRVILVTDRRGQGFGSALPEVAVHRIRAGSPSGGVSAKARALLSMVIGYGQARGLLRALGPSSVVGFGGYPSVPTVFAATRLHLPVLLHEQNAVLGRANRLFVRKADVIATSFPAVEQLAEVDGGRIVLTGNPVRPAIAALRTRPFQPPEPDGPFEVLVTGGSQGAHVFSELVPPALAQLPEELRQRLRVSQQCRREDLAAARRAFGAAGIACDLADFFRDMPERLARAHLVICRSGASTVAELATAGRPGILVPYPHAMDNHQTVNALAVAEAGGAWLQPQATLDPAALARLIEALMGHPDTLTRAAAAARAFGHADAAANLADAVLDLAGDDGNGGHAEEDVPPREAAE